MYAVAEAPFHRVIVRNLCSEQRVTIKRATGRQTGQDPDADVTFEQQIETMQQWRHTNGAQEAKTFVGGIEARCVAVASVQHAG